MNENQTCPKCGIVLTPNGAELECLWCRAFEKEMALKLEEDRKKQNPDGPRAYAPGYHKYGKDDVD